MEKTSRVSIGVFGLALTLLAFSSSANAAPILQQLSPHSLTYIEFTHFDVMDYSAMADVTAAVSAVDITSTSGCEAADFSGFPSGNIALLLRTPIAQGGCTFEQKAENAAAAGASGVLIMNNQVGVLIGTLGEDYTGGIPVFGISLELGFDLLDVTNGLTMRMFNDQPIPGVPEPAMLWLVASGVVLTARRRRRIAHKG